MSDPFVVSSTQGVIGANTTDYNTYTSRGLVGADSTNTVTYYAGSSQARLAAAGLPAGGRVVTSAGFNQSTVNFSGGTESKDWRLRISCPALGYPGVQGPLAATNGVVFPYTPQVTVVHQANYTPQRFTHSNYPHYAYESSEVQAIQITGEFTAQNYLEAQYVLACIYFFRSATKMFFGQSASAGNPPPLVFLYGYGTYYFPNVPCAVTQFSQTMPPDIDYISTGTDRIPTTSQMSVILQPMYSKTRIAQSWSLESFAAGGLVNGGFL